MAEPQSCSSICALVGNLNKAREMNMVQRITQYVAHLKKGTLLDARSLVRFCDSKTANRVLAKLHASGVLGKAARGVYYKPTGIVKFGFAIKPKVMEVVDFMLRHDKEYAVKGVDGGTAQNIFGVDYQVPMINIYYVSGRSRVVSVYKTKVYFRHVPRWQLALAGTTAGIAVAAIFALGQKWLTQENFQKIAGQLTDEDKSRLHRFLQSEEYPIPLWLRPYAGCIENNTG